MRVGLLDLSEQYRVLWNEIRAATDEVLASQRFILGPKLAQFEKAAAEMWIMAAREIACSCVIDQTRFLKSST